MIDLSIILLTFNQERFVRKSLESILSQEFDGKFEVIIYDDFSTDGTFSILENLVEGKENTYLFRNNKNLGLSKNYQNAFLKCKGKYIAYLEGDDYWTDPFKIQKQFTALEQNQKFSLAFHDFVYIDENSNLISASYLSNSKLRKDRSVSDMLSGCLIHQNTIMYRKVFSKLPIWFFLAKNHDTWLLAYLSNWGPALYVSCSPLHYRIWNNSLWSSLSQFNKQFNGLITILTIFPIAPIKKYHLLIKKSLSKIIQIFKLLLRWK